MIRRVIRIEEEKCNGCGMCANACHEGAIGIIEGKAKLLRDDYCDGLGDCLPACPMDAISFVEREAKEYNEEAVAASISKLEQWPVQIKLAPVNAPYFNGSNLLIAADCTAYAYGDFHNEFMKDCVTLIGCTKLDSIDYSEKLCEIIRLNDIKEIRVIRMIVPCCGGMEYAVKKAIEDSGKEIVCRVVTISTKGRILNQTS